MVSAEGHLWHETEQSKSEREREKERVFFNRNSTPYPVGLGVFMYLAFSPLSPRCRQSGLIFEYLGHLYVLQACASLNSRLYYEGHDRDFTHNRDLTPDFPAR
jgi:hypothetical protein